MKTMIAVPCMDDVKTDFCQSCVGLHLEGEVQWNFARCSLIYEARNLLAESAVNGGFDRILWLDSDMSFSWDLFNRLSEHLEQGREMVTGIYFTRKPPIHPVIYNEVRPASGDFGARGVSFDEYERDSLFPVAGCGFGAVMMQTELLRKVRRYFGAPFSPQDGLGEDLAFCRRVRDLGTEIWCDSSIKCGHTGYSVVTEEMYDSLRGGL